MIIDVDVKHVILEEYITSHVLADTAGSPTPESSVMSHGRAVWMLEPTNAHTFSWHAKNGENTKGVG